MKYTRSEKCVCNRMDDGGIILLNEENNNNIVLNNVAAYLYDHCEEGTDEEVIRALISSLHGSINVQDVEADCKTCFRELTDAGVLVECACAK